MPIGRYPAPRPLKDAKIDGIGLSAPALPVSPSGLKKRNFKTRQRGMRRDQIFLAYASGYVQRPQLQNALSRFLSPVLLGELFHLLDRLFRYHPAPTIWGAATATWAPLKRFPLVVERQLGARLNIAQGK
jgi:hypothetical protein